MYRILSQHSIREKVWPCQTNMTHPWTWCGNFAIKNCYHHGSSMYNNGWHLTPSYIMNNGPRHWSVRLLEIILYLKIYVYVLLYSYSKKCLALASGESPVRYSMSPFIIQEPLVSPGWTLLVTTTARFVSLSCGDFTGEVMVRMGMGLPARDWHNVRILQNLDFTGLFAMAWRSSWNYIYSIFYLMPNCQCKRCPMLTIYTAWNNSWTVQKP